MHARNRRTRAAITGTLERVYGHAGVIAGAFGRSSDGRLTYEHEGGTRLFWDSSEQVSARGERIYLDENDEHVAESDVELHQPDRSDESKATHKNAESFLRSMVADVDDYTRQLSTARASAETNGEEAAERAVNEAHDAFRENTNAGVEAVEVAGTLVDLSTAQNTLTPTIKHVDTAVIRLKGTRRIQIRCRRDDKRFRVDEISTTKYGHTSRVKPDHAAAPKADLYANTILQNWGL